MEPSPTAGSVAALLAHLRATAPHCITGAVTLPARAARYAPFPAELAPRLRAALAAHGITRLYCHQRQAWDAIRAGHHTLLVTPTASGKTLCYNLPVLHAILTEQAKALYLFPTKALSQDQVAELLALNEAGQLGVRAYTFDGDTPADARRAIRLYGDIVVSNPDMLHQGILPHHTKWAQFFDRLQYVVIDEMHTYRGVFGAHMANVLRRLRRVCSFYGCQPVYILCSATLANPVELARQLVEAEVVAITDSGAPQGEKTILLWNPPLVHPELGIRQSARSQTVALARLAVSQGLKTLVFAQSRLMVEILTKYLKEAFDRDPRRPARVAAYRGGYLPRQRRTTERQLRAGAVDCVVTTSALELGVDIGALDVCILNGYPGTIAATWQRLGRVGRRGQPSLGILVATSAPLDQYIVRHPECFFAASPEQARLDPDQLLIFSDHVRCAAFELPFADGERFGGPHLPEVLAYLEAQQVLHHEAGRWHWMAESYPANSVSLRSVAEGNFVVIDRTAGKQDVIAEVDYTSAPLTLYEGAIYLLQAQPWQVEQLDWEGRKAFVRRTQADYYTEAVDYTRLKVLDHFATTAAATVQEAWGEVHLVRRVAGYKKIRYHTHENVGYGQVNLPDQELHTTAVWWQVPAAALRQAFPHPWQALDGFLGAAYAMHCMAALVAMAEPYDLGRAVGSSDATWFVTVSPTGRGRPQALLADGRAATALPHFAPTVFLYDNYPGGIGLSPLLYDRRHEIVRRAQELVGDCACRGGCPACIGPVLTDTGNDSKAAALRVLALLAGDAARDA
ncbi:MAG: helicase [Candidatus Tectimicrobiota bacterium]|nr:MAG: helicase [Candidatus Tectomicrobia bacterium]